MTTLIITIVAILYLQGFNEWCKKDFLRTWEYAKTSIDAWDKIVGYGLCVLLVIYPVSFIIIAIMAIIGTLIEMAIKGLCKVR